MSPDWLEVHRGNSPLLVSFPHTGTELPADLEAKFVSPWQARRDADWWVDRLYDFAAGMGTTTVRTRISRSVIDVNRDPSGVSLYPGQATTELCPTTDFDGDPLYREGAGPNADEIARRREAYFVPYHTALRSELERLRGTHSKSSCSRPIPSARASRGCSRASYRSSTSAPTTTRVVRRN